MNRGIPDEVVEEVRARCGIVDVVGRVVSLKKAGNGSWKACCPFHQEKTPSFVVSEQRQRYHCFGCGAGGDVFKFVMQSENVDFPNAVHLLAGRCGVIIPENSGNTPEERREAKQRAGYRERLYRLLEDFTCFFQKNLFDQPNSAVGNYLRSRQLDVASVRKFRLGAAPDSWDAGMNYGKKLGYTEKELLDAGVILYNEESRRTYDRFRNRLVFAIWNEQGKVVGFSARTIEKEAPGAKYVNSPETPVFRKSHILYALPLARAAIGESGRVILCEGQLDVIAMHRAGYAGAVAPQGTAFTEDQARILRRYTDLALLAFDADSAGQKAILRALEILFPLDFEVRVIAMPQGEDPDGIFRARGADGIREIVENSIDVLDFLVRTLKPQFDMASPFGQSRFLAAVLSYLEKLPNPVVRENYARRLSELLQLRIELIYSEINKLKRGSRPAAPSRETAAAARIEAVPSADRELHHAEITLLEMALVSENMARRISDAVPPGLLSDSSAARALNLLAALALNGEYDQAVPRLNELDRESGDAVLSRLLTAPSTPSPEKMERAFAECMTVFDRRKRAMEVERLMADLKKAESGEQKAAILRQLQDLK